MCGAQPGGPGSVVWGLDILCGWAGAVGGWVSSRKRGLVGRESWAEGLVEGDWSGLRMVFACGGWLVCLRGRVVLLWAWCALWRLWLGT